MRAPLLPLPTQETLRQLFEYSEETGYLFWKQRPVDMFPSKRACRSWNSRYAGKQAFTAKAGARGGFQGCILGKHYLAHRVIFKLVYDAEPLYINHIDGDPNNNAIKNLRAVTALDSMRNQSKQRNNTSGVVGVCWIKQNKKWRAAIGSEWNTKFLGYYSEFSDAVKARLEAEAELGFHPNHGRDVLTLKEAEC